MERNYEENSVSEHNMVKNPKWQEADQLAIYKYGRGVNLGLQRTTPASGQKGTWNRDPEISSPELKQLCRSDQ